MTKQIFCKPVSNQFLFDFLEKVCLKTEKYYLFDLNAYRKMIFYGYHEELCENLKEHYHLSKQFYLERKMCYNSIVTIFRQICKHKNIAFTTKIKYNESVYNINYMIYFSSSLEG
jgi:hypothetical protein